jgi:hypothetical protein
MFDNRRHRRVLRRSGQQSVARFQLRPNEACPCESGRRASACCLLANGQLWKTPTAISPPPPRTGYAHPNCYLASLGDCSREISREHYVSRAVLECMPGNGTIRIHGMPWLAPGEAKEVGVDSVTAKILCSRHNSALSELDDQAARFFRTFRKIAVKFTERSLSRRTDLYLFSGTTIEMWMVKIACGIFFSRIAESDGVKLVDSHKFSTTDAIRALTGGVFPPGGGMYMRAKTGGNVDITYILQIAPLTMVDEKRVVGALISVMGQHFEIIFDTTNVALHSASDDYVYRPTELIFTNKVREQKTWLSWPPGMPFYSVTLTTNSSRKWGPAS